MVILLKHHNQNQQQSHLQPTPYHNQPKSPEIEKVIVCRTVFLQYPLRRSYKVIRVSLDLKVPILAGKRDSCRHVVTGRHSTTSISENAVVVETTY